MEPGLDVAARIREALAVRFKREPAAIRLEGDLREDLGLDSLDMIEMLFKIEEVFDLQIPNEDLVQIRTVGDVIAYVERRLADRAAGVAPVESPPPARRAPPVAAPAPRRPAATRRGATPRARATRGGTGRKPAAAKKKKKG